MEKTALLDLLSIGFGATPSGLYNPDFLLGQDVKITLNRHREKTRKEGDVYTERPVCQVFQLLKLTYQVLLSREHRRYQAGKNSGIGIGSHKIRITDVHHRSALDRIFNSKQFCKSSLEHISSFYFCEFLDLRAEFFNGTIMEITSRRN
jgi:hypothetical protein